MGATTQQTMLFYSRWDENPCSKWAWCKCCGDFPCSKCTVIRCFLIQKSKIGSWRSQDFVFPLIMRHFDGGWPAQIWKCALWTSVLKLCREIYPTCVCCGWWRESRVEEPLEQPTTRMNLSSRTESWPRALAEGRSLTLTISTKLNRKQRQQSWQEQQKSAGACTILKMFHWDDISYSSEMAFG